MNQQAHSRAPSSSAVDHQFDIKQHDSLPPSPGNYCSDVGLGLGADQVQQVNQNQQERHESFAPDFISVNPPRQQPYPEPNVSDSAFDLNVGSYGHGPSSSTKNDVASDSQHQSQPSNYLSSNLHGGDFSLFPSSAGQVDQLSAPLFEPSRLNPGDLSTMASPGAQHSPTPPNLLQPDRHQPGSAQQSPAFSQHQLSSLPVCHSKVSLGPDAALIPNQLGDWSQPQFQGHRRSPSEYSDVSSVAPSPNLASSDNFDNHSGHSPLQGPSDGNLYQEVLSISNFSIADTNRVQHGRSPSHSPVISPRIQPQTPEMDSAAYGLASSGTDFAFLSLRLTGETFPSIPPSGGADVSQLAPPAINIDFAPNKPSNSFELSKSHMDQDSLTPPDRGRPKSRPRSVTDPFHPGGIGLARTNSANRLSPSPAPGSMSRSDSPRSLSPLDRQAALSSQRRRQSTSAAPNNVIALRLADPEYQNSHDSRVAKRLQKHPATFQCTLCPKRFTRAYNLRSHLRTHTDERPFVCTVCGKAFARQHDRKRHEGLHSGEKKFVCKGELKASGQWGCGRRFARADALGRHFRSEAGRICIKPLLDEEIMERQRQWQEQHMQQSIAQNLVAAQSMAMHAPTGYPMDAGDDHMLPAALLAQYPALAQLNWSQTDAASAIDDNLSGRSSFDASDFDEGDDGGYVSGSGKKFGDNGINQNFGEIGSR